MATQTHRRHRFQWRRWNNVLHRDLGYLCVALTIVYAVSGIAVNHIHDWNPNYTIEQVEQVIEPIPMSDRSTMVALAVERLDLPGPPSESFRPSPKTLQLFYDGWSVEVDVVSGVALVERPRSRVLLREFNDLHLNHLRGVWTWVADIFGGLLILLAVTGTLMLKGKKGFAGRGKWFVLAGSPRPAGGRADRLSAQLTRSTGDTFRSPKAGTLQEVRAGLLEPSCDERHVVAELVHVLVLGEPAIDRVRQFPGRLVVFRQRRPQAFDAELLLVVIAGFDHAVGEQHHRVAAVQTEIRETGSGGR